MAKKLYRPELEGEGVWTHFTMQDGLPDMKIECVFEDSREVLWIGTHDRGVVRYEGNTFHTFSRRDGLSGNGVFSIVEDLKGNVWFATNRGLTRYDGQRFKTLDLGGVYSFLWGSCVDHQGRLWFGLDRRSGKPAELCRWDGRKAEFIQVSEDVRVAGESIHKIICDGRGVIWVGAEYLYRQEDDSEFVQLKAPSDDFRGIQDLLLFEDQSLWIAAEKGVWDYKEGNWDKIYETVWYSPISLLKTKSNVCWMMNYGGEFLYYDGNSFVEKNSFDSIIKSGIYEDRKGRIWIFTYGMGIYCYDTNNFLIISNKQGLPANMIECIVEDKKGILWIGTKKGMASLNHYQVSIFNEEERLIGKEITNLFIDYKNRLWISTYNGYLFVAENGKIKFCIILEEFKRYRIKNMANDKKGRVWFGSSYGKGFGYWNEGNVVLYQYKEHADYPSSIGSLIVDSDENLWLGSANPMTWDGLCRYNGYTFDKIELMKDISILVLYESSDGCLWIGTNEGLCRYDGKNAVWFTQEDGLFSEIVTAIMEDKEGTLWIGTEGGGVCRYDGSVFQVIQIPGNVEYNVVYSIFQDSSGRIWFGTKGGLIQYMSHHDPPDLELISIIADREYSPVNKLHLSNNTKRIRFIFKGKSSIESFSSLVYRYRLYGLEKEWHQGRNTEVEYSDLGSGEYTFLVQAIDCDFNYSRMVDMKIVISEDPWIQLLGDISGLKKVKNFIDSARILIIDEDFSFGPMCQHFLLKIGCTAEVVSTEKKIRHYLKDQEFDIVVLGINNDLKDAIKIIWEIKRDRSNLEILCFVGYEKINIAREMVKIGAHSYLMIPCEPQQIIDHLEKILIIKKDALANYIRVHAGKIDSRDEVANIFKMSPGTVSNRIMKISGFSFSKFLQFCRIREAQRLLVETSFNIQQIASRVGMSHAAFTRVFKQFTDRSPVEFRREVHSPVT